MVRQCFGMAAATLLLSAGSEAVGCVLASNFAALSPELRRHDDFDNWLSESEAQKRSFDETRSGQPSNYDARLDQFLNYSAQASPFQILVAGRWVAQPDPKRSVGSFVGSRVRMYGDLVVPRDRASGYTPYLVGTPYSACNHARVVGIAGPLTEPRAFVVIEGTVIAKQGRPAGRGFEVQSATLTDAKIVAAGGKATARLFLRGHRAPR